MGAKILREKYGISARLIDMHTIKPLDTDMIKKCAGETGAIVTVEEHSINGGLGSAVAEYLMESGFSGRFKRIGLPDEFAVLGETVHGVAPGTERWGTEHEPALQLRLVVIEERLQQSGA